MSFDTPADNKAFKEKFDFPFELLSDADRTMSKAYGAATDESKVPSRVSVLIGPDGSVAKAYEKVTPAEHPDEVIADLERLG